MRRSPGSELRSSRIAASGGEAGSTSAPAYAGSIAAQRRRVAARDATHAAAAWARTLRRPSPPRLMQTCARCHCTSDGPWVPARLGPRRARLGAYVWRSLIDSGCIIPNSTDAPVERISPWRNLFSTTTRFMNTPDNTQQPFYPVQRMNRHEALLSMTAWGAQGIFAEDRRGRLRPGYQADIAVINRDPMTCSVWHMARVGVVATVVAGEVVYEK